MNMGHCPIDHSLADVQKKLSEQETFLSSVIVEGIKKYLTEDVSQEALNDIFHLLKKYDLADAKERTKRDTKLAKYIIDS